MTPAQLFRQLAALGLDTDQIAGVLEIMDAEAAGRKEKGRERWHRWNSKKQANVSQRLQTDTNVSSPLTHVEDNLPTKEITGQGRKKTAREEQEDFESELRPMLDAERIQALVDVRKKKGGKLNGHSARLLKAKILECGLSPAEAADKMALRNWISIERSWIERDNPTPRSGAPPGKRMNAVEANRALWENLNEQTGVGRDNGDAELLPPDNPRLLRLVGDVSQAMRWPK